MEFVTKLNPQGTGLVYSTFLGATPNAASDIRVDAQGGAYVSAQGGAELSEGGYLSHLSADGSALVYSTYVLSATGLDLDLDSAGSAFVAGASGIAVLAASPGAFQSGLVGITGNVIAAKFASNGQFAGATYAYVSPTAGAGPLIVVAPNGAIVLAERRVGHQHLPVADGRERGERHSGHRRSRRDRYPPWLWDRSRDPRGRTESGASRSIGRHSGHVRRNRRSSILRAGPTGHRAGAVGDRRPNVHRSRRHLQWWSAGRGVGIGTGSCRDGSAGDFRRREFRRDAELSLKSGKGGRFHNDLRNRRRCDESPRDNWRTMADHCHASDSDSAGLSVDRGNECHCSLRRIGSHARIRILPN